MKDRELEVAIRCVDEFYHVLKDMVADKELTEGEIFDELGFTLREAKCSLAALHSLRN